MTSLPQSRSKSYAYEPYILILPVVVVVVGIARRMPAHIVDIDSFVADNKHRGIIHDYTRSNHS